MNMNILGSPSKYIQGRNALGQVGEYFKNYGKNVLFLADKFVLPIVKDKVEAGIYGSEIHIHFEVFSGESTEAEIERVIGIAREKNCSAIAGCGGGKTVDTAKAAGVRGNLKVIVIPTAASTDAPCSALSVIYSEDGEWLYDFLLPQNPDLVLVDTEIIARAPARLLVSGIGDAFATYYEARACRTSDADNMFQGKGTNAAFALAKLCRDILLEDAEQAKQAVESQCVTKALENVIEANIYLSGVGFESNGCAIAHGIYNGFTQLKKHEYLHGECVAFGTLVQLIVENAPWDELKQIYAFFRKIGLPTCLADLGLHLNREEIEFAAKASDKIGISHNMPFEVDWELLRDAIILADAIGKRDQ